MWKIQLRGRYVIRLLWTIIFTTAFLMLLTQMMVTPSSTNYLSNTITTTDFAIPLPVIGSKLHHPDHVPIWVELERAKAKENDEDNNLLSPQLEAKGISRVLTSKNRVPYKAFDWSEENNGMLLTLFTTLKVMKSREQIHHNTLNHWAALSPTIRPVLFSTPDDENDLLIYAQSIGWLVYPAPSTRNGIPIMRDMFEFVVRNVRPVSFFVGYANSDIIFATDLEQTLTAMTWVHWYKLGGQGLLLIGKRVDILTERVAELPMPISGYRAKRVKGTTRRINSGEYSLDYFITTTTGFPFHSIPDFVVGKVGYDNWLLSKAIEWQIRTIDCSNTITAFHQVNTYGSKDKGWLSPHACMNLDIIKPFAIERGKTTCTPYYTEPLETWQHIQLYQRVTFPHTCYQQPLNATEFASFCSAKVESKLKENTEEEKK